MHLSLKRLLSNLNVVAIQNSFDGFRNTLSVRNNSKISRWIRLIRSVTSCNWFVAVTGENVWYGHLSLGRPKHIFSPQPLNQVKIVDTQPS